MASLTFWLITDPIARVTNPISANQLKHRKDSTVVFEAGGDAQIHFALQCLQLNSPALALAPRVFEAVESLVLLR